MRPETQIVHICTTGKRAVRSTLADQIGYMNPTRKLNRVRYVTVPGVVEVPARRLGASRGLPRLGAGHRTESPVLYLQFVAGNSCWKPALNAFAITFADRFPAAEAC